MLRRITVPDILWSLWSNFICDCWHIAFQLWIMARSREVSIRSPKSAVLSSSESEHVDDSDADKDYQGERNRLWLRA